MSSCNIAMNALTVQNPCHKCDWETRMTTDKKIIAKSPNVVSCPEILFTHRQTEHQIIVTLRSAYVGEG